MSKGNFKNNFSSYFRGFKNKNFSTDANEIELEVGKNVENGNDKDKPENNSKNRISITGNVTDLEEAFEEIKRSSEDHHSILFIINESFKRFESKQFENLFKILRDKQVTAFQCDLDGTFCIAWKKTEEEIYAVNIFERNNIEKEDLKNLCKYILEFLHECLQNDHSGLSSANKNPAEKFNIDLPSLTDTDELNLFFHAASNGNTQIIPILLQIAFNVNMMHDRQIAGDLALRNEHYETVLELLKHNAAFPFGFNDENCPNDELKTFVKMSEEFHNHIMASNLEEIRKILSENLKLRYFYNISNQSALAVALLNKKFEVYELLLQNNIYLSATEDIDDQTENLSEEEKRKIREIHFNNKKDIHENHLFELLKKSSVGHDDEKVQERLNHVMRAFQELNKFPMIQILLKIAALLPNLQIIFDFHHNSVEYLDPTQDRSTFGLFYLNGRVYVGALQLLNPLRQNEVFATIAHELCHFVLFSIFDNMAKPYKDGDEKTKTEFEAVSINSKRRKRIDEIIKAVYDYYPPERFHAELIVRIPHFYAHYYDQPDKVKELKEDFKSLFDFYEINLLPKLEKSLKELTKKAKGKENAKKRKIIIISLIVGLIAMTCVGFWFYEPSYQWSELDNENRMKVLSGNVRFGGVEAKFKEIYGQNDTANGVFDKLTSDQIKILINNEILNLNEDQNEFLQKGIFLTYQNLTENLKEKVKKSSINFQGQPVVINSLLGNKTEKVIKNFNSTEIVDLIKDKKLTKIGQEIKKSTKFHIERIFLDKHFKDQPAISLFELINESKSKKVILLSDDAGNGKTTTFKHLAWEWKQKFPLKWVEYVDLKSKIEIYQKYQNESNTLKEILSEIFNLNYLNFKVFEMLFDDQNVVILWDGFDEISPTYSKFMFKLMKTIKSETQNIQFISTRPHYEKSIENLLNCSVYKLEPLTKDENENFLNDFYYNSNLTTAQILKTKEKATKLIAKVQENTFRNEPKDYIESPLMLKMIAEASLNNDQTFDFTNLYTIYDSFINTKLKLTDDKGDIARNEEIKIKRKGLNLDEIFQYFAVKSFFYDLEIIDKYKNKTLDTNLLSRYGILIFDSNGIHQFVHRTFQEFFLTQYLVENFYDFNDKTNCDDINERLKIIIDYTIYKDNPKVEEFLLGYFATFKSFKISQNLLFCLKNHSELNNMFHKVFYKDHSDYYGPDFDRVNKLLEIFPFTSESLEILWKIDQNKTFFSEIAALEPKIFLDNLNKIQIILTKYFPNNQEKARKLLHGKNQQGSFLYGIYKYIFINFDDFNVKKYLQFFNISLNIIENKSKNVPSSFEFYKLIKSKLTDDEIQEMFKSHFVLFLFENGLKLWNEMELKFTQEELQELIYVSKFQYRPLLYYVDDYTLIKLIFQILDDKPDSRFVKFIQYNNRLVLTRVQIMLDDNFEIFWNATKNRTTKNEKKKILESRLLDNGLPDDFNIFDASIEFGSVEKFEVVKNIYEQNFNSAAKMREFCENYFKIGRKSEYPWHPNADTAEFFVKYIKSLFTIDEIKIKYRKSLEQLYELYSEREKLDTLYPFFSLLKELNNNKFSENFNDESKNFFRRNHLLKYFDLPSNIDPNSLESYLTFFDFFELIKSHLALDEVRDYLKLNFVQIIHFGGVKIWNEIESNFTRKEFQELIYESKFEYKSLLWFLDDFALLKLIFETLDDTPDSRFLKFIQHDKFSILINKESIMLENNFEFIWNVIKNRTTKNERKNILELKLINSQRPDGFYIFSAAIEFGTVQKFELVKNIYEKHFNSTKKMQKFCENYFSIEREPTDQWHAKNETAEAFVKYLKSLFTIEEIKSKFKWSLSKLYVYYSERENLDYSYPLFNLLKELNNNQFLEEFTSESKIYLSKEKLLKYFDLPTNMDANNLKRFSTFVEFYDLIKSHLSVGEIRDYSKLNFASIFLFGGAKTWNEIELKFTREELQKLIYESKLNDKSILWYVRDFKLLKLIFKTLKGTPDSRLLNFFQNGKYELLVIKELLMHDDNFEVFWNVIKNRTTEDERKNILELKLLNKNWPSNLNIFSASIEFGTVETFELVKNIYEQNFNSTAKIREFCKNYFRIGRKPEYPWHPKAETAELFVKYLKSLFTFEEIKSEFKESIEKLHKFYSEREKIDDSYPLFSLLGEL